MAQGVLIPDWISMNSIAGFGDIKNELAILVVLFGSLATFPFSAVLAEIHSLCSMNYESSRLLHIRHHWFP
jgi:hypothetical protein